MNRSKTVRVLVRLCLIVGVLVLFNGAFASAADTAPKKAVLTSDDCIKCHDGPPEDIATAGMKHKTMVTCTDCHSGHRPRQKKNIPVCSQCHQGRSHFELKDCLACHRNPHTPQKIIIPDNTTDACLTCHDSQIKQLRENKSKHTALDCTTCHGNIHRTIPDCLQCHTTHGAEIAVADCRKCHKAHMPKVVIPEGDLPSAFCGTCHKTTFGMLTASKAKHSGVTCTTCHQGKHKTVPKCQDCHGSPHPDGIMFKFPICNECHKIAHDLNNWTADSVKEKPVKR